MRQPPEQFMQHATEMQYGATNHYDTAQQTSHPAPQTSNARTIQKVQYPASHQFGSGRKTADSLYSQINKNTFKH